MRGKKVPTDIRAKAVGLAVVVGQEEAGRQLGIPKQTIHDWMARPEFVQLRTTARETVGDQFWVAIQVGLDAVYDGLQSDKEPLRSKSDALAMLIEKRALLMGEATARTEVQTFNGRSDHEREAIAGLLRQALEGDSEPGGSQGVLGDVPVEDASPA